MYPRSSRPPKATTAYRQYDTTEHQKDVLILVVGPTGAGKSEFINCIMPRSVVVGNEQDSCTTEIKEVQVRVDYKKFKLPESVRHRRLFLIDTPGFDCSAYRYEWDVPEIISNYLDNASKQNRVLGGLIYLQDISLDRITGTTANNLDMLKNCFSRSSVKHLILGATKSSRFANPHEIQRRFIELKTEHGKEFLADDAQAFLVGRDGSSSPPALLLSLLERFDGGNIHSEGQLRGAVRSRFTRIIDGFVVWMNSAGYLEKKWREIFTSVFHVNGT